MMSEPRRLRGHKRTVTCCMSSRDRPGLIATSGEDGCICWFDIRCKDVVSVMDVGNNPISSLCFKPGNEDIIYVSAGNEVKGFDVHMAASEKPLQSYSYNKEEINQIAFNSRSSFLAAADDSGEIKIIDIHQKCIYKTLRAGHTSICSTVQFLPWKSWEVISGGLDSKLVMWDFSKGRPYNTVDFGTSDGGGNNECLNPAFVHAIAVPEVDMLDKWGKICVVAKGDGVVDVIDIGSEEEQQQLNNKRKPRKLKGKGPGGPNNKSQDDQVQDQNAKKKKKLHLDFSVGGHTAAVSCVAFSNFGEKGKYIISGGNDKSVKVWDWSSYFFNADDSDDHLLLHMNINLSRKVNWVCTTPTDSDNVVVCDTSKVVKLYTVV